MVKSKVGTHRVNFRLKKVFKMINGGEGVNLFFETIPRSKDQIRYFICFPRGLRSLNFLRQFKMFLMQFKIRPHI